MTQPNILLVVSDQERHRGWLPGSVRLPWRERLRAEGLELTNHYTHSSPCSPSRASLFTGRYISQHGVVDNVIMPEHTELDPGIATIGSILRDVVPDRPAVVRRVHPTQRTGVTAPPYGRSTHAGSDVQGVLRR